MRSRSPSPVVAAARAASNASTERRAHFVNSMATAAAIIARADGRSDPIERREFIACARRSLSRAAVRRWNVSVLFDERVGELERNPNRTADLLSVLDVVAGTPRAWIVLRTAERVAQSIVTLAKLRLRAWLQYGGVLASRPVSGSVLPRACCGGPIHRPKPPDTYAGGSRIVRGSDDR